MNLAGKKLAICGYPPFAEQLKTALINADARCDYFVTDFIISDNNGGGGIYPVNL